MGFSDLNINEGKFLKIDSGQSVTIRILSKDPVKKLIHHTDKKAVPCTGDVSCLLCTEGNPAKVKWACNVFNRKTQNVQIFEFGHMIGKQLKSISKMLEDEGNSIHVVDLRISADGEGLKKTYTVFPKETSDPLPKDLVLHELK